MDLSDAFAVVAWDAPGAGSSSDPTEPFTIQDWAEALGAFLYAIGIEQAHLVGLSWGGLLAQEFYRSHAARVRSLILADTYAGWRGSLGVAVAQQRLARCARESSLPPEDFVARWVPKEFFTEAASPELTREMSTVVAAFHPVGFRLMARALADSDTSDLLPNIARPTLLLWGDSDTRSPLTVAAQFEGAIPNARLKIIPNAGHVSNMEQPARFSGEVRMFLERIERV